MSYVLCPDCGKRIVDKRRYPVEPLCAWLGMSLSAACLHVGLSGSTQKTARCHGLSRQSVDSIAGKVGAHPSEVWPEVVAHDIEDTTRECAYPRCDARFTPKRRDHKFCSRRCAQRVAKAKYARKRYATDPEYRQKNREAWQRYQAENREYRKNYQRRLRAKRLAENPNFDREHYQRYRETNLAYAARKAAERREQRMAS